ncbi:hypothetical protein WJX82_002641 [Trebouxia sp. C0006]
MRRAICIAGPLLVAAALLVSASAQNPPVDTTHFAIVGPDNNFQVGCETFWPAIFNQWEVLEAVTGAPILFAASLPANTSGPQLVRSYMDTAIANNLNVMRIWAQTVGFNRAPFQTSPGVYNENIFRGLDYTLDQARQRNLKVIMAFVDNWVEGVDQYAGWAGLSDHVSFFTDPKVMQLYKNNVEVLTSRVNTINGRKYSEDPTIFAWDLINEPRCNTDCPAGTISGWVTEMAAYVKSLDPNHLLTVGEEGFYTSTANQTYCNPSSSAPGWVSWVPETGQDAVADHASPDIDFIAFHSWIDNWQPGNVSEVFQRNWIECHANDGIQLNKPVILEEFGKFINATVGADMNQRNQYYGIIFDEINKLTDAGKPIKGVGFWTIYEPGQDAPASEGGGRGVYGIYPTDDTFGLIKQEAQSLNARAATVPGCDATAHTAPAVTTKDCTSTQVKGLVDTGFEGPTCTIDINECVRGTDNCAANAACINTQGGFQCQCWLGYTGDGVSSCTASPAVNDLPSQYVTEATQGPLICDVMYPIDAPGSAYDPTLIAGLTMNPQVEGVGNVAPVYSPNSCMVACETAPGCSAFAYSPQGMSCFLKGCPSNYTVQCPTPPPANEPAPAPPAPPAPPEPPCTNPNPTLCPVVNATYYSYYHKTRYQDGCTFAAGNPGLTLAPAPTSGEVKPIFAPGTPVAPETAAGNNPSSLGAAPIVTSEGPSTPVDGQPSIASVPTRASTPATAAGNEPLPGPDGPVPGTNTTAVTNGTALPSAGSNLTSGNITSSIMTAGR